MPVTQRTLDLLRHLSTRPGHDEAKAGFQQLLIDEFDVELGALEFERRVPEVKGRLDALIGRTIFEAKSDLVREWADVARRMPDYLADREREEGEQFVGIATDGLRWVVFELAAGALVKIKETTLNPEQPEAFLAWLDGAVALKSALPPEPLTVRIELGQGSVAFRRARDQLDRLWHRLKARPDVILKRQLWAQLLKLVYGRDVDADPLWFQHTFLVITAKAIALAVLNLREDDPKRLLSGAAFQAAGINGAVESDFFDWVTADSEGEALVARIVAHVRRFRLQDVQSDILKVLYESLIDAEQRHGLGEYYTPDWLAAKIVRHVVDRPLEQKVLDPACGSGTFVFHAVRRMIEEAPEGAMATEQIAEEATRLVAGMDIHPVAVIIARVTYLLALAPVLSNRTAAISIPVYLGDALQLSISQLFAGRELVIRVPPPPAGEGASGTPLANGAEQLDFPETFCRDPGLFDKAIERMRTGSEAGLNRKAIEAALHKITEQHYRADVKKEQADAIIDLGKTYVTFDRLRKEGRDSVWAYVARNLSRPLAFSTSNGWANIVVGNPPWVAFRHMNAELQKKFKELGQEENVYVGGRFATQNDLCALFSVRAASLYLRPGGRLAFVLPLAVLSRGQFERLRTGSFNSVKLRWEEAWTMDDSVVPLFPVPACAVFGRRRAVAQPLPDTVRAYSGSLPMRDAPEAIADARLKVDEGVPAVQIASFEGGSPYRSLFRRGATLVPRMLCLVDRKPVGRLGQDPMRPAIFSRRSPQEKAPWKSLPGLEGNVEREFLRPVLLGESIVPYRVFRPFEGVIPIDADGTLLDADAAANRGWIGLHGWMKAAESIWNTDRPSEITYRQQLDYYGKLSAQFPVAPLRVIYAASGSNPAATLLRADEAVIEHILYWHAPEAESEGHYLVAFLNSETARARTEGLQARGQFGARHFDKVIWTLPIPRFDAAIGLHRELAATAAHAETVAATVDLPRDIKFQRARSLVRVALREDGVAGRIDRLVAKLLG